MAEHAPHSYQEGPYTPEQRAEDFQEHESTYKMFISLLKWGTGIVVVILLLLYIFLV